MQSVCARVYLWEKSPKSEKCIFSTERLSTRWIIFLKLSCPCSQALPLMCCGARFTDRWCSYFEKQYYKLPCPRNARTLMSTCRHGPCLFQSGFESSWAGNRSCLWTAVEIQDRVQNCQAAIREQRRWFPFLRCEIGFCECFGANQLFVKIQK